MNIDVSNFINVTTNTCLQLAHVNSDIALLVYLSHFLTRVQSTEGKLHITLYSEQEWV